jgi:APA family basic amino acid/polyamine antiporter
LEMRVVPILMIAVVTSVNVWGTRKSSDLLNVTTIIKVAVILVLGAALLVFGVARQNHVSEIALALGSPLSGFNLVSSFGFAMIMVLWAYEGWQFGTYSAGEVLDPQKSFPRAFFFGSLILVGLYLFAVIAYLVALGPPAAMFSDTIAASAAKQVLGPRAGMFVAGGILVSTFSSTHSVVLTAPRVFFAMATDNLFFKKLAQIHPRFGTPAAAIVILGAWSCVLTLTGGFEKLTNEAILIGWIFYGLGAAAIFPLRRAMTGQTAPYRVPGYPFTPFLFVLAAASIVANAVYAAFADPRQFTYLLAAIALVLLGLPGYFFWSRRSR